LRFEPRRLLWLWIAYVILVAAGLAVLGVRGLTIDGNILSLLPATERDPVVARAMDRFTRQMAGRTLFLVGHRDEPTARTAAAALVAALTESGIFNDINGSLDDDLERDFYELYFPFRYQMLSPALRREFTGQEGMGQRLTADAEKAIYSPMSALYAKILDEDPLLLFPAFSRGLTKPPGALKVREGWLGVRHEATHYILVTANTVGDPFSRSVQKATIGFLDGLEGRIAVAAPGAELRSTGVVRFAAYGSESAMREVSTIGTGSLVGVILLFLLTFGSLRPLLAGLVPVIVGVLSALVISFAIFGNIHLLTLGFGTSLIGISIDYTAHFFCESRSSRHATPALDALRAILPAISLGALTSIMGYLGLFVAPFPGLRQIAVFSSAGLFGAYATVVLAFPALAGASPRGIGRPLVIARHYLHFWHKLSPALLASLAIALALPCAFGLYRLKANDDIRQLQNPPAGLTLEEGFFRKITGGLDTSRFLLVEGSDAEEVLQREERLYARLADLGQAVTWFQGISAFVPSMARQRADHQRLQAALLGEDQVFDAYMARMGFVDEIAAAARERLSDPPETFLTVADWLQHPASSALRHLWLGATERGEASLIVLGGVADSRALEALETDIEGVYYIDKVTDISSLLHRYRVLGSRLVALSYLAIFLLLIWRYGFLRGLRVTLPPLIAACLTLAVFGLVGWAVSLFHVLALLLVLGIGIDYTIFFAEYGGDKPSTMLAVMLSALTTLLSFGLLALSATPVLQGFGVTVGLGILIAWLLSPLAAARPSKEP